jgi:branched-chain amino acid transport system substrate-binding protein
MKQNKAIVVILCLFLVALVALSLGNKGNNTKKIKIGFSIPLTGDLAFAGEGIKVAAEMAKESFGQTKFNYEFVFEDDEFKAEKTASAANKLISVNGVNAIVSFGGTGGNIVSPIAEKSHVVHFGVTTDLNVAKGDYNFIHFTLPGEQTRAFISELQKRGIKKLAYFTLNSSGYLATEEDVKINLKNTDIQIVSAQKFNFGEKDFRSYISKAKLVNADIWVLGAQSPEIDVITQQIKEAGVNTPITSINSFEVSKNPNLYEGQWYVGSAAPSQKFTDAFTEKSGHAPTFGAANIYDIVSLIIAGAEQGKDVPTPEKLLAQVNSLKDFHGALGVLNFNDDGSVISQAAVKVIMNGKPTIISQ